MPTGPACRFPGTLVPVPWQRGRHRAGAAHACTSTTARRSSAIRVTCSRNVLAALHARSGSRRSWRSNTSSISSIRDATRTASRSRREGPLTGRREYRTQINSMTDLNEYSRAARRDRSRVPRCRTCPRPPRSPNTGPGQYEVNLAHAPDALRVCDEALRFKRIVKSVARAHGCEATFLPKPYRDMAGSGLHIHVSLLDAAGRNIFAAREPARQRAAAPRDRRARWPRSPTAWRFARRDPTPIGAFGPKRTCRCIRRGPSTTAARPIRVPASDAANLRIEHRLAGADANPYLVLGLGARRHAARARAASSSRRRSLTGNAYIQDGDPLPTNWPAAIERFAASEFARATFGEKFVESLHRR